MSVRSPVGTQPAAGPHIRLGDLFEAYRRNRALGPENRTLGNYRDAWFGFISYLSSTRAREAVLGDVTGATLNEYLRAAGSQRDWSDQTKNTYARNIRAVVSGLRRQGLIPPETLRDYQLPKVASKVPERFSDAELGAFFDRLEGHRSVRNLRLRAAGEIVLDCGARPSEVAALRLADLRPAESAILLHGKGNKDRVVPVGQFTWRYIADWTRVRPGAEDPQAFLFTNERRPYGPVSANSLADDFREVLEALGLRHSGSPGDQAHCLYTLRKTFAHRAAEGGMDVGELAAIMGHEPSSIPMLLKVYYRPSAKQLRAAHAAARPADALHEARASRRPTGGSWRCRWTCLQA